MRYGLYEWMRVDQKPPVKACRMSDSVGDLEPNYSGRRQFKQWPGQGPDNGYPRYPDVTLPGEREKFRAFERDILKLLAESKTHYAVMAREYALEVQSNG